MNLGPLDRRPSQLSSFLELILKDPRLASAVRVLAIGSPFGYGGVAESNTLSPLTRSALSGVCHHQGEQDQWSEDLLGSINEDPGAGHQQRETVPRETYLLITVPYFHLVVRCRRGRSQAIPRLAVLQASISPQLSWRHNHTEDYPVEDDLCETDSVGEVDSPQSEKPLLRTSNVTEIEFSASNGKRGMFDAIYSCARLELFKYEHADGGVPGDFFDPCAFRRSLEGAKSTLRSLWLDYDSRHYSLCTESEDRYFGSLVEFTALRNVHLRYTQLLDMGIDAITPPATPLTDTLPFTLETLRIADCFELLLPILVSQLHMVVANRQERTPNLVEIVLRGTFGDREAPQDHSTWPRVYKIKQGVYGATGSLRASCEESGIRFHIEDNPN
ncbi:hypothetical protein CPC735_063990 [Coccidioides posadasii C735 delta SOWgp]|uniref:Leucine-rich repeat domain-containing protein n=1 Tax=Coccidioides posadasii (strain C735) TaxID=222929 RepID=C5P4A8_COCP7|nr:hypothetical protein CPC735_063990 [Coccidioides posadasii C735 delta SOWgp]EER28526.1 hypothetical protein CPC735_063990 [Coccidioides posadasii C735 delta SOWgp]|eukprot:XP_003070671.1 hypothetical protein CPC735_063990 [Coccidioides posadasii C735 delta SOWgp]